MTKRRTLSITLALALATLFLLQSSFAAARGGPKILEFDTMVGVPAAFGGTTNAALIRNVPGGGLPWMLTSAKGELSTSGKLEIGVTGLVLAAGGNAGSNPVGNFRGLVSCLTTDATIVNVSTGDFPATTGPATAGGGNAKIEATLDLPNPCIAPIVFVTNTGGSWFSATGGG